MKKVLILIACSAVLFVGLAAILAPSEARRGGGGHGGGGFHGGGHRGGHMGAGRAMHGNINRSHVNRNVNVNRSRHVNRDVNVNRSRHVNRDVNVNRKYVYRNGRRGYWRNGVWVVAPLVAGATYAASCSYEYNRWQSTGSSYWRDRYYNCAN